MNKEFVNKINELIDPIVVNFGDYGTITYRDSPSIKEIISLLKENKDEDELMLEFKYKIYQFVTECYTFLGRYSLSAEYRLASIKLAKELKDKYNHLFGGIKEQIYKLIKDRNYYVDDDCEDLIKLLSSLITKEEVLEMINERKRNRRSLKHDPIEMSEEYLNVIDEVEEKIEHHQTMKGTGSCFEIWELKEIYLLEKGIRWKSPIVLNPHVKFD